ncbi:hypothetical protein [Nocardia sp. NPDC052566]|uniref:hypothetical protein n=1 Tax=Nocardia sp. NPDC052566 TaxID=3364330 RepID=UPI0037C7F93E
MSESEFEAMFLSFQLRATMSYMRATKLLLRLPLPISLEPFSPEMTPTELVDNMKIGHRAVKDLPMPRFLRVAVSTALLDWMSGVALAAVAATEEEIWTIEAALVAVGRANVELELAEGLLDGDIDEDDIEIVDE